MSETDDDIRPLATGGHVDPVALARVARKVLLILTPVIVGLVAAVWGAIHSVAGDAGNAAAKADHVEGLAAGGYKRVAPTVDDHDRRIVELERLVRQLAAQQHPPARVGSRPRAPAPVLPALRTAKTLPPTLDQALKQAGAPPPAPAPRGDAAP